MERDGLITLVPDPSDGRAKVVRFSRRGAGIGKAAFEAMDNMELELSRRIGARALAQFKNVLFSDWGPVVNAEIDRVNDQPPASKIRPGKAK